MENLLAWKKDELWGLRYVSGRYIENLRQKFSQLFMFFI
jgi:hypothetical protein